jgi:hypothetical protein
MSDKSEYDIEELTDNGWVVVDTKQYENNTKQKGIEGYV